MKARSTVDVAALVAKSCSCGVTKAKARRLAAVYDQTKAPINGFSEARLASCKPTVLQD